MIAYVWYGEPAPHVSYLRTAFISWFLTPSLIAGICYVSLYFILYLFYLPMNEFWCVCIYIHKVHVISLQNPCPGWWWKWLHHPCFLAFTPQDGNFDAGKTTLQETLGEKYQAMNHQRGTKKTTFFRWDPPNKVGDFCPQIAVGWR